MSDQYFDLADRICLSIDQAIRAVTGQIKTTPTAYPAQDTLEADLSEKERKHAAALMRINHAGEICAQALYNGQAILSRGNHVHEKMQTAAMEESDHLHWCRLRLDELGSRTSYLSPMWYGGSFLIGMAAAAAGDAWSLGFVAETETQVINHLEKHMNLLPKQDERSHKILFRMKADESKHREEAIQAGAKELPLIIKKFMTFVSKVMVKTAYWI